MALIKCAFCKGTGKDPFELLSKLATCQVCRGAGKVKIEKPAIECAFCKGTGIYPYGARITCTVCNGKGKVFIQGETEECPECGGTARATESGLPCIKCRGKGVILNKYKEVIKNDRRNDNST